MVTSDLTSSNLVLMISYTKPKNEVMVATESKDYSNVNILNSQSTNQPTNSTASPSDPTPNVVPTKLTIKPLEDVIHKSKFNPHARDAQNYNIVEDLAQDPSTMSPTQNKNFLSTIGCINPLASNLIVFNHQNHTPLLLTPLAFIIWVVFRGKNIHHSIVDEGAPTYIMSMSC